MNQIRVNQILSILMALLFLSSCHSARQTTSIFSDEIQLVKLSKNTYLHRSYLALDDGSKVDCNGMVIIDHGEALVFDSPSDESSSLSLIRYLKGNLGVKIVGVVANHFHDDCVGGLSAFHHADIPSYSHLMTIELAEKHGNQIPRIGFDKQLNIAVGKKHVECRYLGAAHSPDNIVAWFPDDKVLFGGCMVKSMNATKGNVADADVDQWPKTVARIKESYPEAETVIPGHGQYGGVELLDYTIELFSNSSFTP